MHPELITGITAARRRLAGIRHSGESIGLVPTMGALHAGHGALIERARSECDRVVVSIFVNPIQFDRPEDYADYAIDLDQDLEFCGKLGVDLVFAPSPGEMYAGGHSSFVEITGVSEHLCGRFRPGHFRGVATVVAKLFHIVGPDRAYFGEKDAQQLVVIQRMVLDLNIPVEIVPVPTVREADGLASSSRNRRLTPEQRRVAPVLFRTLQLAADQIRQGCASAAQIKQSALAELRKHPEVRVEYLDVVDAETMTPVGQVLGPVRIAAAMWVGTTRLIDNVYCPAP